CNVTPRTLTSVVALTDERPAVGEVMTTLQDPVPPDVVQALGPTKLAGPVIVNVIVVPLGAFANAFAPALTFTWPTSVWVVPIGLFAVAGVICTLASTKVAVASPEFAAVP